MRIQAIEITDYKAFLGTHKIEIGGKNVFIYGENGSGKSSLYYALKDFFQTSVEDIDLTKLENVFVPAGKEGKTAVKVTFKPDHQGQNKKSPMYSAPRPMIPATPVTPASVMATGSKASSPTSTCWPFII